MISILKRIPLVQSLVERRLQKESQFYLSNRQFVLSSYRYLLKTIPTLYSRRLQQKQKLNELQYIFRSQKVLETLDQTKFKSERLKQSIICGKKVVEAIKDQNYENLGEYEIALYCETRQIEHQLKQYNKKFGLDNRVN